MNNYLTAKCDGGPYDGEEWTSPSYSFKVRIHSPLTRPAGEGVIMPEDQKHGTYTYIPAKWEWKS